MSRAPSLDRFLAEPKAGGDSGRDPVVAAIRRYRAAAEAHLLEIHRAGAPGRVVNETNADLVDRLLCSLFERADREWRESAGGEPPAPMAVVAVGGYGRREMAIHSDVDLLFLYDGSLGSYVASVSERIKYRLYDAGLAVGCATRTLEESIALGASDATVRTALLDARLLCGDPALFERFEAAVRKALLSDLEGFVAERWKARRERHRKYGESLYLLQPNVKEGMGALRDHHSAMWAARALDPETRSVEDLARNELLTREELPAYVAALDFLWRLRNELHFLCRRKDDQMSFEHQELIATNLGYGPSRDQRELAVERFMGDYYRHARSIRTYSELVLEQCQDRARRTPLPPGREVEEGFHIRGQVLQVPDEAFLRERPLRMLLAFEVAQRHDVRLSRTAGRLIRGALDCVDDGVRRDPEAVACFLRILGAENRVSRALFAMNEIGLLGRFLPEWQPIVCRWQHVVYHTYTVDVHSIFLVEELRRLWKGDYRRALPELTELIRDEADLPILYLGCLLHDVGKGRGGDHSNRGATLAQRCAERLGLPPGAVARVVFLVRYHLLMSYISHRRDLSDPRLIVEFARTVGDRQNLRKLYLLTFADIRASSRAAWNDWKGQLLSELFERTAEFLEAGRDDPALAIELLESRVEARREGARRVLVGMGVAAERIDTYFAELPRRYFIVHGPQQIARHARVVLDLAPPEILSTSVRAMRGGFTEFLVCTPDVHGLYSKVAGVLTAKGVNILGAHVYTLRSGLALEVYRVTTPPGGETEQRETWRGVETMLRAVLTGTTRIQDLVLHQIRPLGRATLPSRQPPSVSISNRESDFYTIVDVMANDRLGLLYDLTRTIAEHDLEIYISKAATLLDQVVDTFYVKDRHGRKLGDPESVEKLQRALLDVVQAGEGEG